MIIPKNTALAALICFASLACSQARSSDDERERATVQEKMKKLIGDEISAWHSASRELAAHAPLPAARGWDATLDRDAIAAMKTDWGKARWAYERIEGAIAPMFPESDAATDARYDDFLMTLGAVGDANAFDDQGVVGVHAVERVLWADAAPPEVVTFERGIPGYRPAKFPANAAEARDFRHKLAERLVNDIEKLQREFQPLTLDVAFAFRGLMDLAAEQVEKVDRAATGQEESRYAQATMRDLRANREGCLLAYRLFQPWLLKRPRGAEVDGQVLAAFSRLEKAYTKVPGDAIPRPPKTWSSVQTSPADLATPFGELFTTVKRESDEKVPGSLRASLAAVAEALALPEVVTR